MKATLQNLAHAHDETPLEALLRRDAKLSALARNLWRPVPIVLAKAVTAPVSGTSPTLFERNYKSLKPETLHEFDFAIHELIHRRVPIEPSSPLAYVDASGDIRSTHPDFHLSI